MKHTLLLLLISITFTAQAGNPLIKDIGMSDPHIRVFNDTVYLFTGHDDHPDDKLWVMKDWRVFSSTDLVSWKQETTISTKDNYMPDNSKDCWAGDAATRNGKYYFYFSDQKRSIGVMVADSPGGHYVDALGKPLVSPMHDPTAFIDDDENKTPYIIYGDKEGGGYRVARLNEDMISLAETTKPIQIIGEEWESAPKFMDKNYLFKHKGTYYLSWGRDYATSTNVYGPYTCVGAMGNGHKLDQFAHGSFFWYHGQYYHIWTYYLRSGFKYRECIITYCHFDNQGNIVTDMNFLDKHFASGVGQYESSWPKIEAEWYYGKSEALTKQDADEGGFEINNIENGSWLKFANMDFKNIDFESKRRTFQARVTHIKNSGAIEIRLDSPTGELIGTATVTADDVLNGNASISCNLNKVVGKRDLYLSFTSEVQSPFNLNYFSFGSDEATAVDEMAEKSFSIFPNPSHNGVFYLNEAHKWNIFYTSGVQVARGNGSVVDLSAYGTGIYLFRSDVYREKLVVR